MSKRAKWVLYPTAFVAALNFFAFWTITALLGGSALNGYIRNAHYFICHPGPCKEVSKSFWDYSYWHGISAIGGIFLIFVEAAVFVTTKDIEYDYDPRRPWS